MDKKKKQARGKEAPELVPMRRNSDGHIADVHPSEVDNYRRGGYQVLTPHGSGQDVADE